MTDIRQISQLHTEAMDLADKAFAARRQGDEADVARYSRLAFQKEAEAAHLIAATDIEPTRSVLHRSAATLALDCGEVREAEKLVAVALAGNPPAEIADELRDLFEQVLSEYKLLKQH